VQAGTPSGFERGLGALRQFAAKRPAVEVCELCAAQLASRHPHLIEVAQRKILCACNACAILFSGEARKYKRVPERAISLPDFHMTDAQWDGLRIPINMAFFFKSSLEGKVVALYPSPAGATESLLPLETWSEIEQRNPALKKMQADVEGLLVNRVGHARGASAAEYFLLPIDECYKLVGIIRMHWRGLSGGTEVWQEIANFFADVKSRAVVQSEDTHA
jgi:uncharacterized protein DUF5947